MTSEISSQKPSKLSKPTWLKVPLGGGKAYRELKGQIQNHNLHTVCEEAHCPNKGECWSRGVATLMILGDICTRSCAFCNVTTGKPNKPDFEEPERVAHSVARMGLQYVTLTSVDRDDLPDLGAGLWAQTIQAIHQATPQVKIECLVPDFQGRTNLLDIVLDAYPNVLNHNLETVQRLQKSIRKSANWNHSFDILSHAKSRGFIVKTGLMLGLGETIEEVEEFIHMVAPLPLDILTLGQYLQPSTQNIAVQRWVHPSEFSHLAQVALKAGIQQCQSGPLVRSSYHAAEFGNQVG